jgi:hypothetical protein
MLQQPGPEHCDEGGSNRCGDQDGQHNNNQHYTRGHLGFRWVNFPRSIKGDWSNGGLCIIEIAYISELTVWANTLLRILRVVSFSRNFPSLMCTWSFITFHIKSGAFFLQPRPWFENSSGHVGLLVDEVALGQVFSEYFGFPYQFTFHGLLHIHYHLSSGPGKIGHYWQ